MGQNNSRSSHNQKIIVVPIASVMTEEQTPSTKVKKNRWFSKKKKPQSRSELIVDGSQMHQTRAPELQIVEATTSRQRIGLSSAMSIAESDVVSLPAKKANPRAVTGRTIYLLQPAQVNGKGKKNKQLFVGEKLSPVGDVASERNYPTSLAAMYATYEKKQLQKHNSLPITSSVPTMVDYNDNLFEQRNEHRQYRSAIPRTNHRSVSSSTNHREFIGYQKQLNRNIETDFNNRQDYRNSVYSDRDPEEGYRDPEQAYRDPEQGFRDSEQAYRDLEQGYRRLEQNYRDPRQDYREPDLRYRDAYDYDSRQGRHDFAPFSDEDESDRQSKQMFSKQQQRYQPADFNTLTVLPHDERTFREQSEELTLDVDSETQYSLQQQNRQMKKASNSPMPASPSSGVYSGTLGYLQTIDEIDVDEMQKELHIRWSPEMTRHHTTSVMDDEVDVVVQRPQPLQQQQRKSQQLATKSVPKPQSHVAKAIGGSTLQKQQLSNYNKQLNQNGVQRPVYDYQPATLMKTNSMRRFQTNDVNNAHITREMSQSLTNLQVTSQRPNDNRTTTLAKRSPKSNRRLQAHSIAVSIT